MAKFIPDPILDLMNAVKQGDKVYALTGQPSVFADIAALKLAEQTVSGGNYAAANGDTDGRKQTLQPPAGAVISANGSCTHVAVSKSGTTLLEVWTVTTQLLTSGGTVDFGAIISELGDPA